VSTTAKRIPAPPWTTKAALKWKTRRGGAGAVAGDDIAVVESGAKALRAALLLRPKTQCRM